MPARRGFPDNYLANNIPMTTVSTDTAAPAPGLADRVLGMIDQHGSPEERKVLATGRGELKAFLEHPDTLNFTRRGCLDIGLENRPVLKFNLMAKRQASPWGLINEWADRMPQLAAAAETVFRHKLRCHAGIKLSATGVEYEIYPYETSEQVLANGVFSRFQPEQSGLPTPPHCFGCSSTGELSAYSQTTAVDLAELEEATGFALPASGLKLNAMFNSRLNPDGSWRTDKAGIEFLPFPSYLLNTVLSNFNLRFAYLLHRGGTRRYGVVGVHGTRQVLYTTLLARVPREGRTP